MCIKSWDPFAPLWEFGIESKVKLHVIKTCFWGQTFCPRTDVFIVLWKLVHVATRLPHFKKMEVKFGFVYRLGVPFIMWLIILPVTWK